MNVDIPLCKGENMNAAGVLMMLGVAVVGVCIGSLIGAPLLMLASRVILKKSIAFAQAFLIVASCVIAGAAITWPVHAGIGDVPEGRTLANIMGWAVSFGVMTALVDKATSAGLTRSATVAALNFVFYLAIWMVVTVALMGAIMALMGGVMKGAMLLS